MDAQDEFMACTVTNSKDTRAKMQRDAFLESRREGSVGFQYLCANT